MNSRSNRQPRSSCFAPSPVLLTVFTENSPNLRFKMSSSSTKMAHILPTKKLFQQSRVKTQTSPLLSFLHVLRFQTCSELNTQLSPRQNNFCAESWVWASFITARNVDCRENVCCPRSECFHWSLVTSLSADLVSPNEINQSSFCAQRTCTETAATNQIAQFWRAACIQIFTWSTPGKFTK